MRLLVSAHDPLKYRLMSRHREKVDAPQPVNPRLRSAIVDLSPPQYSSCPPIDSYTMFSPPTTSEEDFIAAVRSLTNNFQDFETELSLAGQCMVLGQTFYQGCLPTDLYREYCELNHGQRQAVEKVLSARDYALLLGMPGSVRSVILYNYI
jgi:hypothetical protein